MQPKSIRREFFSIRVTSGERASIRGKAKAAGLPVATYIRKLALGGKVRARRGHARQESIYHLSKIGNNLNQLAHAANSARQIVAQQRLEEALAELREVLGTLRE